MKVSDVISEDLIIFIDEKNREDVLKKMIKFAYEKGLVKDTGEFEKAVFEREKMLSTGIGLGIAVPHAKLKTIDDFFIVIAILKEPVDWDSIDGKPVKAVFLIGGPETRQKDYLSILSRVVLLVKNSQRREKLFNAKKPADVVELFKDF